jgi:AcrR family transcriptional regulator
MSGVAPRERLIEAAIDVIAETGYAKLTVAQIVSRAKLSRKTFYDIFPNREACCLAVYERESRALGDLLAEAYSGEALWRGGIRSALETLLRSFDEDRDLARLLIVEPLGGGEQILKRRAEIVDRLAAVLEHGSRNANGGGDPQSEILVKGLVGGALAILHARLLAGLDAPLSELLNPLMYWLVLSLADQRAARRELGTPLREARGARVLQRPSGSGNTLASLRLRVTYRTVQVLAAIEQSPGASNREVAKLSGIKDAGQISKLLARLSGLELIDNHGLARGRGVANAWHLTALGRELIRASGLRERASPALTPS